MALNPESEFIVLTKDEFLEPISSSYAQRLSEAPIEDLLDNYNSGPTKSDGSVNFECHCVSHLVASPCGHEFRQAISCQKNANENELKNGACADEFINFMQCTIRTECFRKTGSDDKTSKFEQAPNE